jgi:thiol:disulfide interchange protein DsbD
MLLVLLTAFAAGFILNFMPCVLPVIGLKIMAFVQQSGDSRARIFMLNVWYSLGMLSVFLVLASLAVFVGLSWGQQFSSVGFNITLSAVVFVFALSFLGVWEIPIPGFVGSGGVQSMAEKEGPSGAFLKGVLTTILATPCSGPMLTPALTWAVSQPPAITYVAFSCVGFGMAAPYLLIGAFPRLIAFLPKPGAWMDTFKQIMGFVLLGTVVFLLTFMPVPYVVPTLAFLVGLWAAFWWIGRTPLTETFQKKLRAWTAAALFGTLIGLIAFAGPFPIGRFQFDGLLNIMQSRFQRAVERELSTRDLQIPTVAADEDGSHELPWQPFSVDLLTRLTRERRTVFVDFTADW